MTSSRSKELLQTCSLRITLMKLVLFLTRRIFAFTRALCWGETLVLLHVVSQGFFCNDGLSCNCFCIGMLKMQGYYYNIQVENIVVMPIMGYCFKYFFSNHVFHYYFFELSKFFLLV